MNSHTEAAFETAIEYYLTGKDTYRKTDPAQFDRERCLDPAVVLEFIKKTQAKEWEYLKNIQKDRAETTLLEDLAKALNSEHEGCLSVLRHGFKSFGKLFRVAYFRPGSGLNPETLRSIMRISSPSPASSAILQSMRIPSTSSSGSTGFRWQRSNSRTR